MKPKIVFTPPEPHVLNEAWGGMSLSMYQRAVKETPPWKIWILLFKSLRIALLVCALLITWCIFDAYLDGRDIASGALAGVIGCVISAAIGIVAGKAAAR